MICSACLHAVPKDRRHSVPLASHGGASGNESSGGQCILVVVVVVVVVTVVVCVGDVVGVVVL